MTYNGATYYYITNIQGDVVAILDESGQLAVYYTYEAYGYAHFIEDNIGCDLGWLNPLRYRGYVFDYETGLYYLQSRYYNPTWCRFLNADALVSTGQGVLGNNMFIYCNNNPVNALDVNGFRMSSITDPNVTLDDGRGGHRKAGSNVTDYRRDVTREILEALQNAAREAKISCMCLNSLFGENEFSQGLLYFQFYQLVNHNAAWDIKRAEPWETTIGTTYPGFNTYVEFSGLLMTPEQLGNVTYGFLGYVYGIPYEHLVVGSCYAAGFPTGGTALANEIGDWFYVYIGYVCAMEIYP